MNIREEALSIAEIYTKNKNSRLMLKANIESLVTRAVDQAVDEALDRAATIVYMNRNAPMSAIVAHDKILALKSKNGKNIQV